MVNDGSILVELKAKPTFLLQICRAQKSDPMLITKREQIEKTSYSDFHFGINGILICVPKNSKVKQMILQEAHSSSYSIQLVGNKMYGDLKQMYWWPRMKCEISKFVSKCLVCHQVKVEH
ncbi:CCHC-type integrase [Gossypium australe]|uniref:CCHC-type integrase n=1 Tax=Gossypium australe TaxID=47621 RepID=A0A5B6UX08_9ROSI|nr:CCHC-type integrase [Gossypium australe]